MTRFFVAPEEMAADTLILTGENANHARVLRLKAGEQVLVCDGDGRECLCAVEEMGVKEVTLAVLERRDSESEAAVRVSVYMAFPKADKLEHVIQKATELGAYEIVAFPSARCISKPDEKSLGKKLERWQKIAASAAEQSGRGRIPLVLTLPSYAAALDLRYSAVLSDLYSGGCINFTWRHADHDSQHCPCCKESSESRLGRGAGAGRKA